MAVSKVSLLIFVGSVMLVLTAFDGTKVKADDNVVLTRASDKLVDTINDDVPGTYCDTLTSMPYDWKRRYRWAAFSNPDTEQTKTPCGSCLKVTNEMWSTASEVARVMDACQKDGYVLELDQSMFKDIDVDQDGNKGMESQTLYVRYEFKDCEDV